MAKQSVPPVFGDWDMPHIGRLYEQIRESRRLSKSEIASYTKTTPGTLTRFEKSGDGKAKSSKHFDEFVKALRQKKLNDKRVRKPLNDEDVKILNTMYAHSSTQAQLNVERDALACVDFQLILEARDHEYLRPLAELLDILENTTRPAFIADSLWFIHAINGAAFNLFGITPPDNRPERRRVEYLNRWEAWHIMGAKFFSHSPVRNAHRYYNDYFPPTVDQFFRMTSPILFTIQMRALLHRLMQMSDDNDLEFTDWWLEAISFDMSYKPEQLHRQIKFRLPKERGSEEITLYAAASDAKECDIAFSPHHKVQFWIGIWDGTEPTSTAILNNLPGNIDNQRVFYAAHYDVKKSFHVNTWPEVIPYLDT